MNRLLARIKNAQGDTLVEVMLAISVFALVLVVTLTSVNRSLHSGTDATNREQALTIAQQQVEYIKNALSTDLQTLQTYTQAPASFCIDTTNGSVLDASATNKPCDQVGGSQYDLSITHATGADNTTVFKVTTTWPSTSSSTTDTLYVYYKVPQAGPNPPIVTNCSVNVISATQPGAATLSGTINPNGGAVSWHFAYGTSPSYGTVVPVPDGLVAANAGPTPVSEPINGLTAGTYYYTLIASNPDGTASCNSVGTFGITAPPPPTATLTASPSSITTGGSSILQWNSTDATTCSATSPAGWTSSTGTSGSQSVSPGTTTNYTITCSNSGGSADASANISVSQASTPDVTISSVVLQSNKEDVKVYGSVNPNGTSGMIPYVSIGNTCDSGADADNPASGDNAGFNGWNPESPVGPVTADSNWHNETTSPAHTTKTGTSFSFYFCGFHSPYQFQQCVWWGGNIANWQANHVCSSIINLTNSGSTSSSSGGGSSGGGGTISCSASWGGYFNTGSEEYSDLFGSCSNAASWDYSATVTTYDNRGDVCSGYTLVNQPSDRFYYSNAIWEVGLSGYVTGYGSGGNNVHSSTATAQYNIGGNAC